MYAVLAFVVTIGFSCAVEKDGESLLEIILSC